MDQQVEAVEIGEARREACRADRQRAKRDRLGDRLEGDCTDQNASGEPERERQEESSRLDELREQRARDRGQRCGFRDENDRPYVEPRATYRCAS
jgi:hypothetical protein